MRDNRSGNALTLARPAVTGTCKFCTKPAERTAPYRVERAGLPASVERVKVCHRHYMLHWRYGRFYNEKTRMATEEKQRARRERELGAGVTELAIRYGVSYRTMRRCLNPKSTAAEIERATQRAARAAKGTE